MNDTITLPRSVVEQALEALNASMPHNNDMEEDWPSHIAARRALRAALKQPQVNSPEIPEGWKLVPVEPADSQIRAAQDTWWHACNCETYWDQIYAAMIAAAPQPPVVEQPQGGQEPICWVTGYYGGHCTVAPCNGATVLPVGMALYTHPQPKREPLTDAQINDHRLALPYDGEDLPDPWDFKQGVRAAERAHGIGGDA